MAHVRRQIREAIAAAVTGLATTGARVFLSRVYPLQSTDLPALIVRAQYEISAPTTLGLPRLYERTLRIVIDGYAKATADLDDTLDQICAEVEIALAMPVAALGDLAKTITLVGTELELTGEGDQPVGRVSLSFDVFYVTAEDAPDSAI